MDPKVTRRDLLVQAARELYETKGANKTSVKDITEAAGTARSLFYHYFQDKDDITDAVLDSYVQDFIESVRIWNENRTVGDVRGALRDVIKVVKRCVFDNNLFRADLISSQNSALYLRFLYRSADGVSTYMVETTVKDYEAFHSVEIDHIKETFYVLIVGLTALMRANPTVDEQVLMDIVAQTLKLELN